MCHVIHFINGFSIFTLNWHHIPWYRKVDILFILYISFILSVCVSVCLYGSVSMMYYVDHKSRLPNEMNIITIMESATMYADDDLKTKHKIKTTKKNNNNNNISININSSKDRIWLFFHRRKIAHSTKLHALLLVIILIQFCWLNSFFLFFLLRSFHFAFFFL